MTDLLFRGESRHTGDEKGRKVRAGVTSLGSSVRMVLKGVGWPYTQLARPACGLYLQSIPSTQLPLTSPGSTVVQATVSFAWTVTLLQPSQLPA